LLVTGEKDQQDLILKAIFEADRHGLESAEVLDLFVELRTLLEKVL
jgi:hypothetical protein